MTTILSNRRSKFGMTCVQCSNELIAPEWSEYRNERQVLSSLGAARNAAPVSGLWSCFLPTPSQ